MCSPRECGSLSVTAMSCREFFSSCFPLAITAWACFTSSVFPEGQKPHAEQFVKGSLFVIPPLFFQTQGTINPTLRILPLITASENKPFQILFYTEMINPGKPFASLTHPSAVSVLFFSTHFAEHFPPILAAVSGAPLLPPHTPHLTLGPTEDAMSRLLKTCCLRCCLRKHSKRKTRCSPSSCGQLRNGSLLQSPAIIFYWELVWNLDLRNLSMLTDAYTKKH